MELFLLEHKKLWRKRIVKICVLLCFIYIVIFGSILSFQWFSFGSSDDYTVRRRIGIGVNCILNSRLLPTRLCSHTDNCIVQEEKLQLLVALFQ